MTHRKCTAPRKVEPADSFAEMLKARQAARRAQPRPPFMDDLDWCEQRLRQLREQREVSK